ncbi:MAG TPA: diguanylate cyclase [Steroidobacteraceae bacterium]|nr:diguanylate cyclase [Steroidobacteraceae bacterium]
MQVLEHTDDAVIVKDLNAVVTYWNREACSLYGFTAQEAVGQPLRKLHAADLSDADYARILARVRAGIPTSATTERRKKSGETIRVALKTAPLLDPQGTLIGEITIARDVTALHRTEEALRAAQATLQARLTAIRDANRELTREIAARRKTDAEMRRNNKALAATIRQLESFHRNGEALSRMAELLQSCTQRIEAYAIVRETGAQLFPDSGGSLFIYRESRDVLEHACSWGNMGPPVATLAPDECWALRLGSSHFVPRKGTIRCRHTREELESYVCLPVQGQGQVLGLLHVAVDVEARSGRPDRDIEQRLRAMTDRVGPALANLKLRDALREMALRDGLTGLYNRRYLEDALNRDLHRAQRSGRPLSVVMIDVDHFKRFNDKFGHDAGDFVLSAMARAIAKSIRPSDIACRYGGEEFAVVLAEADLECASARADQMRLAIREANLVHLGQTLPAPTASFGIAVYPANGTTAADLLRAADKALYRAKDEGRDRICSADRQ